MLTYHDNRVERMCETAQVFLLILRKIHSVSTL
jgi:hypothetical protein